VIQRQVNQLDPMRDLQNVCIKFFISDSPFLEGFFVIFHHQDCYQ
jgi:hypothetical protein